MSVQIISPTTVNHRFLDYAPRILDGLIGCYIFGGALSYSIKNHALGGAPLSVIGSPTIFDGYVRCDGGSDYFDTGLAETSAMTLFVVARMVAEPTGLSDGSQYIGNYAGAGVDTQGVSIYTTKSGEDRTVCNIGLDDGASGDNENAVVIHDTTQWRLLIGGTDGTKTSLYDDTGEASDISAAYLYPRAAPTANPLLIGGAESQFGGQSDIALTMVYDRWLSADERAAVAADLIAHAAADGIVV